MVDLACPGDRAMPRSSKPSLLDLAVGDATAERYSARVREFVDWLSDANIRVRKTSQLDSALLDYFQEKYELGQGRGRSKMEQTLSAVMHHWPRTRGSLPLGRRALKGWAKVAPSQSWPPLSWKLTVIIAVKLASFGQWRMAIGVLVSFDGLLRCNELLRLVPEDIAGAGDGRMDREFAGVGLRLRRAKTGKNQWVTVERSAVQVSSYRKYFKRACAELGLADQVYVLHSLRHGGATSLHVRGLPIADILLRGRWVSTTSATLYIQSGRALLLSVSVPELVSDIAERLLEDVLANVRLARVAEAA